VVLPTFLDVESMGISPENMAKNMVLTYLHFRILEFPLIEWNSIFENEEIGRSMVVTVFFHDLK
jgi:hypothetical protein